MSATITERIILIAQQNDGIFYSCVVAERNGAEFEVCCSNNTKQRQFLDALDIPVDCCKYGELVCGDKTRYVWDDLSCDWIKTS